MLLQQISPEDKKDQADKTQHQTTQKPLPNLPSRETKPEPPKLLRAKGKPAKLRDATIDNLDIQAMSRYFHRNSLAKYDRLLYAITNDI